MSPQILTLTFALGSYGVSLAFSGRKALKRKSVGRNQPTSIYVKKYSFMLLLRNRFGEARG